MVTLRDTEHGGRGSRRVADGAEPVGAEIPLGDEVVGGNVVRRGEVDEIANVDLVTRLPGGCGVHRDGAGAVGDGTNLASTVNRSRRRDVPPRQNRSRREMRQW